MCACARACVRTCVCVCACVCTRESVCLCVSQVYTNHTTKIQNIFSLTHAWETSALIRVCSIDYQIILLTHLYSNATFTIATTPTPHYHIHTSIHTLTHTTTHPLTTIFTCNYAILNPSTHPRSNSNGLNFSPQLLYIFYQRCKSACVYVCLCA